jgi:hypothetical protein
LPKETLRENCTSSTISAGIKFGANRIVTPKTVIPAQAGIQVRSAATYFKRSGCANKLGFPPARE